MEMLPHKLSGPLDLLFSMGAAGGVVLGLAMIFFGPSLRVRLLGVACFLAGIAILIMHFKS